MTTETQGKTEKNIINQDTKQMQPIELVSPKADVLDQTRLRPQVAHSAEDTSQMSLFCFSKHDI